MRVRVRPQVTLPTFGVLGVLSLAACSHTAASVRSQSAPASAGTTQPATASAAGASTQPSDVDEPTNRLFEALGITREDYQALMALRLPEHATDDDVRTYIRAVLAACPHQHGFGGRSPQVGLLAQLGRGRLPLLLEALDLPDLSEGMHVMSAVGRLVEEEDQALILQNLARRRILAGIVTRMQWEREARSILLAGLSGEPNDPFPFWIPAVVRLRDPNSYPGLQNYLLRSEGRYSTYEEIRDLPGLDLRETVDQLWANTRDRPPASASERIDIARIALDYGHPDAFAMLVAELQNTDRPWIGPDARQGILEHLAIEPDDEDLAAWWRANKQRLTFDPEEKLYRVAPAATATSRPVSTSSTPATAPHSGGS